MTSLTLCFLLLKCQMIVCPSSLHSCVQGTDFSLIRPPGEIMSFGVSPVNYSDSDSASQVVLICLIKRYTLFCIIIFLPVWWLGWASYETFKLLKVSTISLDCGRYGVVDIFVDEYEKNNKSTSGKRLGMLAYIRTQSIFLSFEKT